MTGFVVFVIILAAVFILITVLNAGKKDSTGTKEASGVRVNRRWSWPNMSPPPSLGVAVGHPARSAAERLEKALSADYESRVKDRVMKEHPQMSDKEWNWTWFELKRYFLICGLLRSVPMYSAKADAVWHEMLMFTREYEQFCHSFCGSMIHHAPHAAGEQPAAGDRAWFEWVYGELFSDSSVHGYIWGPFYRERLSEARIREIEYSSSHELRDKWFNVNTLERHFDFSQTVDYLIERAKSQALSARARDLPKGDNDKRSSDTAAATMGMLSGLMIYSSINYPDDYVARMDEQQSVMQRKASGGADSSYGCSGASSKNDDSGHSFGSDAGGDSGGGSSCGGGCSS